MTILNKIDKPSKIKKLSESELKQLAKDVRKRIIGVCSKSGGHIAPSLGTVELTLAILRVFDPPKDSVIWDVGHQSYAWKILTERNERFDSIRSLNGLSGFTNRSESIYDAFGTGHSSTSVSAALGIAEARKLTNDNDSYCISVIGDGALTGGMSFEALNHAGHLQPNKFIVILNDNAMSISKNVGGLQKYMARMLASRSYNSLKKQIWELSGSLPDSIRRRFIYGAQKLEESMMNILVPNIIFEDLGFKYVGPIDGHDVPMLCSMLRRVKDNMVGPVLIHVVTKKGKGYAPAEKNSALFHGIGPFEPKSGTPVCSGTESWSEVMGNSLVKLASQNNKIVAITAAMTSGTGLAAFEAAYPDRFFDVGIAEQHAITFAAGLCAKGIRPLVAVYSSFYQRALDQIIHDVALQRLPVVFCIDRAGIVGEDGATHHGAFDISFMQFVPNLCLLAPSTAEELDIMLKWAFEQSEGPVAIRYPRGTAYCSGIACEDFAIGKAELKSSDGDIALISCGDTLAMVEEVQAVLQNEGISSKLINLRSIKPLDKELLNSLAQDCKYIFTFESNCLIGGVGSAIKLLLDSHKAEVHCFGYPDHFIPHGKISELNDLIGFTAPQLSLDILKIINAKA